MILLAPAIFAAWTTERPTAPRPKTATVEPNSTLVVFQTAPSPVATPHAKRHERSGLAIGLILAALISAMTAYSAKVLQPMKWYSSFPPTEMRLVPSGITPFPCVPRIARQRFVFGDMQKMHEVF